MRPRSEQRRVVAAWATALVTACLAVGPAVAADGPSDERLLDQAVDEQADGRPQEAEATLRRLAERGNVTAMERLALLHWYGHWLYPGRTWSRAEAVTWFQRAAAQGSELGRHMAQAEQRLALREQAP